MLQFLHTTSLDSGQFEQAKHINDQRTLTFAENGRAGNSGNLADECAEGFYHNILFAYKRIHEQTKALSIARLQTGGGEVRMFSALKKQGVDEAALLLWHWAHPPVTDEDDAPCDADEADETDLPDGDFNADGEPPALD